jgi:hypothetical protein
MSYGLLTSLPLRHRVPEQAIVHTFGVFNQ